jgi:hypothetical protein
VERPDTFLACFCSTPGKIDIKMWAEQDGPDAGNSAVGTPTFYSPALLLLLPCALCILCAHISSMCPAACSQQKAELRKGVYVRAIGAIRAYAGTKAMTAYSIRPITDHDEVTFHFLEVCYVKQQMVKQHGGGGGGGGGGQSAWNAAPPAHPYAAGGRGGGGGAAVQISGEIKSDVRNVYDGPLGHRADGIAIGGVVQALGGKYTEQAVLAAVSDLVNDGELYSTIDDKVRLLSRAPPWILLPSRAHTSASASRCAPSLLTALQECALLRLQAKEANAARERGHVCGVFQCTLLRVMHLRV